MWTDPVWFTHHIQYVLRLKIHILLPLYMEDWYHLLVVGKRSIASCFAKLNKPPLSIKTSPPPSKGLEINRPPRGLNSLIVPWVPWVPWVPEVFFSCCLRRKLSGEAAIVTSGKKTARHDRDFPAQFSPQTTGKKPSGTQGSFIEDLR